MQFSIGAKQGRAFCSPYCRNDILTHTPNDENPVELCRVFSRHDACLPACPYDIYVYQVCLYDVYTYQVIFRLDGALYQEKRAYSLCIGVGINLILRACWCTVLFYIPRM